MLTLITLCLAAAPAKAPVVDAGRLETQITMRAALNAIMTLQPLASSPAAFRDPANATVINTSLEMLVRVKHRFDDKKNFEPGITAVASIYGEQVEQAWQEFGTGQTESARYRVRGITGLCFACHTRESVPKDFEDAAGAVQWVNVAPLKRAELFASTRQFDQAIAAWDAALAVAPKNELEAVDQAWAIQQYVSVLVRVKDDPKATVALLKTQSARADLPSYAQRSLEKWLKDANAWEAEKFFTSARTPKQLFDRAKTLVETGTPTHSPLMDDTRFISLLRAGGYLHAALTKEPQAKFRGEALYLLGVASVVTTDPLLWSLDSMYLESCVRENPHTPLALKCANRLYDRAYYSWSGSNGFEIPSDVSNRLSELRRLAK